MAPSSRAGGGSVVSAVDFFWTTYRSRGGLTHSEYWASRPAHTGRLNLPDGISIRGALAAAREAGLFGKGTSQTGCFEVQTSAGIFTHTRGFANLGRAKDKDIVFRSWDELHAEDEAATPRAPEVPSMQVETEHAAAPSDGPAQVEMFSEALAPSVPVWRRLHGPKDASCQRGWLHRSGWVVQHCGHPTAIWPYTATDPDHPKLPTVDRHGRGFANFGRAKARIEMVLDGRAQTELIQNARRRIFVASEEHDGN